jgi:hypothetical protein
VPVAHPFAADPDRVRTEASAELGPPRLPELG